MQVFKRILVRIKKGYGSQDGADCEGKVVSLPLLDNKNCMMVFFSSLSGNQAGYYLIYDFKIDKRK